MDRIWADINPNNEEFATYMDSCIFATGFAGICNSDMDLVREYGQWKQEEREGFLDFTNGSYEIDYDTFVELM